MRHRGQAEGDGAGRRDSHSSEQSSQGEIYFNSWREGRQPREPSASRAAPAHLRHLHAWPELPSSPSIQQRGLGHAQHSVTTRPLILLSFHSSAPTAELQNSTRCSSSLSQEDSDNIPVCSDPQEHRNWLGWGPAQTHLLRVTMESSACSHPALGCSWGGQSSPVPRGPGEIAKWCITTWLWATGGCLGFGLAQKHMASIVLFGQPFSSAGRRGWFDGRSEVLAAKTSCRCETVLGHLDVAQCCQFQPSPDTKDLGEDNIQNTQIFQEAPALPSTRSTLT